MPRRRGIPLFRIGLLLVAGSVLASIFTWYAAFGRELGDLSSDVDTDRRALLDHFLNGFLFAGTVPSILFWVGCGTMILGAMVNIFRLPAR